MAKLIAANYNSTTSTAYGFMSVNIPAGVIKKNTVYTLVARYKWTKGSVDDNPSVAYFYDSGWKNIAGYQRITATNSEYAIQMKVFTTANNDAIATSSFAIHNYACTSSNGDKGAVLSVDWYELWEGDVTQFSLKDAIGLSGAGVNLRSNGRYPNSLTNGGTNGGVTTIDTSKFGYSVIKCVASAPNRQFYFWPDNDWEIGKTYLASVDVYTDDDVTSCNINIERSTIHGYYRTIGKNSWSRVWVLATKTEAGGAATLYGPAGTFYYKNIKLCEAPVTALHSSVWTPAESELNEYIGFTNTDFTTSFKTLQNNCKNNNYFTDSTNGKTSLRNWMGYYSSLGYGFTTSLSTTSVAASGGTITVNYTVKENWTNGKAPTPKAGITPTITSSIGTVSNITATDANGNGTAKITVASRGTTVGAAQTGTVSVSFGGVTRTATFTRALNKITSVRIAGSIPTTGAYTNPPSYNNQAPASGTTWSPFTIYPTFSSGATQGNYGGSAIAQSNWSISGEGFSVASVNGWWAVKVTATSRGTTIGNARTGTLTVTIPDGIGGTVSGSTSLSQESNAKTSITYGTPVISTFSYATKNAAYGTVSPSISYYQTRVQNYISGATETLSNINNTGGTLSYSGSATGATLNTSTGVVTWNANTATSDRSISVTATLAMNGKSVSKAAPSKQLADAISGTVYGNVTAGTITNATIPASGTTTNYTATAGNGSQIITYSWVSGKANTTETKSVAPSVASISATASSKGTTISNRTEVKSQAVTWNGSGGKSASDTMYIYQAGNYITEITPKAGTADTNHFYYATKGAAAGGSVSPTNNAAVTYKFSSGSIGTYSASNVPTGVTWTFSRTYSGSATGATLNTSTGAVTWANNTTTSARSINVTSKLIVTCTHSSTYSDGGTLTKELSHTSPCSQNAGAQVYATPVITTFSYPLNIPIAGGSVTPTLSFYQDYTWNGVANSGGRINSTDSITLGYSYSMTNTDVFELNSTSTGKVTAKLTNDGSIDSTGMQQLYFWPTAARTADVTVTVNGLGNKTASKTATVTQLGNGIKSISFSAGSGLGGQLGAVSSFTNAAGSKTVPSTTPANVTDKITAILATYTLESTPTGATSAIQSNVPILDYINYSGPTYSWSSNGSWATVSGNAATTTVNVTANTGAARSATITRNGSFAVTLKPEYKSSSFTGSDSATVIGKATTTVSQAAGIIKQERAVFYGSYPSLQVLGVSGSLAFQTGSNTSFSSSSYTIPGINNNDESTGITLTETDSTKASSFYIYLNNVQIAIPYQIAPRLHLRVGVKSSSTLFTETWYDQYITADSVVYQDGAYVATWGTSNYALVNIPASGLGGYCHIDIQFTT